MRSDNFYLDWLSPPPADFRQRCKLVTGNPSQTGQTIKALAGHALGPSHLQRLADAIQRLKATGNSLVPLSPIKVGVIGNGTLDFVLPALVGTGPRHGLDISVIGGDYGQIVQEALSPRSQINLAKPDVVLIALDYRAFPFTFRPKSAAESDAEIAAALSMLSSVREGIHAHSGALCIVQTLAPPPDTLFGSMDRKQPGSALQTLTRFNERICESLVDTPDVLLDTAHLAATVGLAAWHSPAQWNLAKLPFAEELTPLYADHVCRLLAALRGKSRRCLILDLDNTVWGGVIGDDGVDGIKIAEGDAEGEAFRSVQKLALSLRDRGVVLAVSSKNTDSIAREAFSKHPEMLLRQEHIAVFQANWSDKATNIKSIATELSLGLDAMVFLDDNPVERGLIRQMLPDVAVPELPPDPALYARTLSSAGYFEAVRLLAEDRDRAAFYEGNARRATLQTKAGDLDAYLASLDMEITFSPFDAVGRSRIAQLISKSNQFNLTTRRRTEAEIERLESSEDHLTLQIRLTDVFGDNGMISVVICAPGGSPRTWSIDTWLMSCRVLGRKVEEAVLAEVLRQARSRGIDQIVGQYIPTSRNALVSEHYKNLGFKFQGEQVDGTTVWSLSTATEVAAPAMRVKRLAAGVAHD